MKSGVFVIKSIITKEIIFKFDTKDFRRDWYDLIIMLINKKHPDKKLQKHFDIYGNKDLKVESLKKIDLENNLSKEIIKEIPKKKKT